MALSESDIMQKLKHFDLYDPTCEESSVYANTSPAAWEWFVYPAAAALSSTNYVLNCSKIGVTIFPATIGGALKKDPPIFIPKADIVDMKIRRKLLSYSIIISSTEKNVSLTFGKITFGEKWNNDNIPSILNYAVAWMR
tara:strand:- start:3081 stop:3497 length:417 start_codon:yes stop_codon:yes gene_type:complete